MMKTYLEEKIGNPELFTGRKNELAYFSRWSNNIRRKISMNTARVFKKIKRTDPDRRHWEICADRVLLCRIYTGNPGMAHRTWYCMERG